MSALVLPTTRDEAWRWSDLSALPKLAGTEHRGGVIDIHTLWLGLGGPRLLFVDGRYEPGASDSGPIAIGPVDARSSHPLGSLVTGEGWTLALGPGQTPVGPIEILHVGTGGASHVPVRIALGEGAQASIVETYAGEGWANRLTSLDLAPEARAMRAIRLVQRSGFVSLRDEAHLAEGASLVTTLLGAGHADTRLDAHIVLDGEGAFAEHGGVLLARGKQRHDAAVVLRHAAPGGSSRQTWRAVADDTAAASLAARVEVARDAQRTDGEQSLRGLLLKRSATVNLKPELEIFADDVKCAHGATIGELDRQALFYLAARGVPPEQARALLTHAFVADALERIGEEPVRDAFLDAATSWLERVA
jgi:Fe-S cluster assembly protein SufD